jgi:hypothetical protein
MAPLNNSKSETYRLFSPSVFISGEGRGYIRPFCAPWFFSEILHLRHTPLFATTWYSSPFVSSMDDHLTVVVVGLVSLLVISHVALKIAEHVEDILG